MITAAAICPCPPLLARELTGQADVLPDLRAACATAVARLTAAAPDVIAVAGPDAETARWPANGQLDLAGYAPALPRTGPALPLSLGIGARLLDEAGYQGPRAFHGVGVLSAAAACLRLGGEIAASAPRVALLVMGDGTARRSVSAPGYLDERAAPFDAEVTRAVRDGDLDALAALDAELAAELLAAGRPAWQVLAGALAAAGRAETEILYADAPFGVAYLVASLTPRPRESR